MTGEKYQYGTYFICEILTRIMRLIFFFCDFVLDAELLGSLSQLTVAMDACHPLCPAWMTLKMNWYAKENLCHQFQHQNQ